MRPDRGWQMYRSAPSLTAEEMHELLLRRAAEPEVVTRIIASMTKMITRWVKAYLPIGVLPLEDLMQEGMLGLLEAIEKYDGRGALHTIAWFYVRRNCARAIRDNRRAMRVKVQRNEPTPRQIHEAERRLALLHGPHVARADVAQHLGVSVVEVDAVLTRYAMDFSLDEPFVMNGEMTSHTRLDACASDAPSPEELAAEHEVYGRLVDVRSSFLAELPARERDFFAAGDDDGPRYREVGARWGVTRQRVHQVGTQLRTRFTAAVTSALED